MSMLPDAALEHALRLLETGQVDAARRALSALAQGHPEVAEPWRLLGVLALQQGDVGAAEAMLVRAHQCEPASTSVLCNLGALARRRDDDAAAERHYREALRHDPACVPALNNLAGLLFDQQRFQEAEQQYRRALQVAPGYVPARGNLAACLLAMDRGTDALVEAERAVREGAGYAPAWLALAQVQHALGAFRIAAAAFARSLGLEPGNPDALYGLAQCADELGEWARAIQLCEQVLAIEPSHAAAASLAQYLRRHLCRHAELATGSRRLADLLAQEAPGIAPFAFLSEAATAAQQRQVATLAAREVTQRLGGRGSHTPSAARARGHRDALRVGFVSSGFGQHPTALLIVELIEKLRGSRIETVGYATTPDDQGALRQRLREGFALWRDLAGDSYSTMARRVREDGPDILIDLRGWGGGSVAELFAQRPAPVQVNWLAYPGTSGAPWIDHLVADPFVIPDAARGHFSENVVWLPRCFQPSDSTRVVGTPPPRAELGLPDDGVVFACFNNAYKYSPESMSRFWRILEAVPGSVLWLLAGRQPETMDNLRRMTAARGIDPQRLVFLPKQPHDVYLACYRHADLFLDTTPYNAHTTASDALWAGCPVLTLPGGTFASRVAGSLNHHLGLADMNADSDDGFVARAQEIAGSGESRHALRERLARARQESGLFDMEGFACDFAALLEGLANGPA